ncbi:MAG: MerR family transcriptional regulator [Pseudomonadota bacterium]
MAQWYIKDFSKLTQVSVQTLYHYDKFGLLKPSLRHANGYRIYSEMDLSRLQQIVALKFFGFELAQIKRLLSANTDSVEHLSAQSQQLKEKAQSLFDASQVLDTVISSVTPRESSESHLPWEMIIKTIEVYHMTQKLEHAWIAKILSPDELVEYAQYEQGLRSRFTESERKSFEHSWAELIGQIGINLDKDPASEFGIAMGKNVMTLVDTLYGREHAALRASIWEKGYRPGKMEGEHELPPEMVDWMDKAFRAHRRQQLYGVLDKVGIELHEVVLSEWHAVLTDMYGDSDELKSKIYQIALDDDKVSDIAKTWIRKLIK